MRVGVPKEIKVHEYRVGLTPASVAELVAAGHEVVVEIDAHAGLGLDDYLMAGRDQLGDRGRRQADPIFVILDFLGHADAHLGLHLRLELPGL